MPLLSLGVTGATVVVVPSSVGQSLVLPLIIVVATSALQSLPLLGRHGIRFGRTRLL